MDETLCAENALLKRVPLCCMYFFFYGSAQYLRENFIEKSIKRAEKALETNDFATAKVTRACHRYCSSVSFSSFVLVEMLDMPRIEKLEEFVGALTTVELNDRYEACRRAVAKHLHKT